MLNARIPKIRHILLSLIVLAALGLAGVFIVRNMLVERAVEVGSEYALGVETNLGSARLDIGGSSLLLEDYEARNPADYEGHDFLTVDRIALGVDAGSLLDDNVLVDSLVVSGVQLNLEQVGTKGNYREILDRIREIAGKSPEDSGHRFRISLLALQNVTVKGSLTLPGQSPKEKSFTLDDFTMRNVGGDNGATVTELSAKIVKTLIQKALAEGGGLLPGGFGAKVSETIDSAKEKAKEDVADKLKSAGESLLGGKK